MMTLLVFSRVIAGAAIIATFSWRGRDQRDKILLTGAAIRTIEPVPAYAAHLIAKSIKRG